MVTLATNWWSLALRGVLAILLGIYTFARPGVTLDALILIFGVYALFDGVLSLASAWRHSQHHQRWGALLIEGVVGLIAALVSFAWPAITAMFIMTVIALWAMVTGVLELIAAFQLRKQLHNEWLLLLTGLVSLIFGIILFAAPLAGALVVAVWLGAYALIFGILMVSLAIRLHGKTRGLPRTTVPPTTRDSLRA